MLGIFCCCFLSLSKVRSSYLQIRGPTWKWGDQLCLQNELKWYVTSGQYNTHYKRLAPGPGCYLEFSVLTGILALGRFPLWLQDYKETLLGSRYWCSSLTQTVNNLTAPSLSMESSTPLPLTQLLSFDFSYLRVSSMICVCMASSEELGVCVCVPDVLQFSFS